LLDECNLCPNARLERAEAIIDLQKKWRPCWACRSPATRGHDGRARGAAAPCP
jgi:hypothetical protein